MEKVQPKVFNTRSHPGLDKPKKTFANFEKYKCRTWNALYDF